MAAQSLCSIPGCGKRHVARGYCNRHYLRLRRNGDPLTAPTRQGRERQRCSVVECGRISFGYGLCNKHYRRWKTHGDPLACKEKIGHAPCAIENCGKPSKSRGWCAMHYRRWRFYGDPMELRRTPNGEPQRFFHEVVLRHNSGDCLFWPYARTGGGYAEINTADGPKHVHRMVCEEVNGPPPTRYHVAAHACGKGDAGCVSPSCLHWKTQSENMDDRSSHGTSSRASGRLTERDVAEIRSLPRWIPSRLAAEQYGVSASHISAIRRGATWSWLN